MVSLSLAGSRTAFAPSRLLLYCTVFSLVALILLSSAAGSNRSRMMGTDSEVLSTDLTQNHWVTTFTTAQQGATFEKQLPEGFYGAGIALLDTTVRQTFPMTIEADRVRIRLSNRFGTGHLRIDAVTIALPEPEPDLLGDGETLVPAGSGSIRLETLQRLTFSGRLFVSIPPGGTVLSDPVDFAIARNGVITISMYFRDGQVTDSVSFHHVSRTNSWFAKGDHTAALDLRQPGWMLFESWYVVAAVEAWKSREYHTAVAIGESTSEGRGTFMKWPQLLYDRMQSTDPDLAKISVVNQAMEAGRFCCDELGPSLSSRLDADVLAVSGVKYAIFYIGANDLNIDRSSNPNWDLRREDMIAHYQQSIARLRAANLIIFGGTLTPLSCGIQGTPFLWVNRPEMEEQRLKINAWIRTSGVFDAVIDFDLMLRDPNNHTEADPALIRPDCLHPNDDGIREIAMKFPLEVFKL